MEKLVLCHQQHTSTVYDARATSLHWNALVSHPINEQPQSSGRDEWNSSNNEQLKTPLPILKALAMEILSVSKNVGSEEATQTNGTDDVHHSCKTTTSTNRIEHKPKVVHSGRVGSKIKSEKKFVRECCTCGLPVRASTPKKSNTPRRVGTSSHKKTHLQPASSKNAHTKAHNMAPVPQHLPPSHPVGMGRRKDHTKEFQGSYKHIPAVHGSRPRIVVHMPKTPRRGSFPNTHTGVIRKGTPAIHSDDIPRLEVKTIMNELEGDIDLSQSSSRSSHTIKPVQAFDTPRTDMASAVLGVGPIPEKGSLAAGSISPSTNTSQVLATTNSPQTTDISGILEHNTVCNSPQTTDISGIHNIAVSPSSGHLRSEESTHMETTNDHEDTGSFNRNSGIDCDNYSDDFMSESLSSISC